jgi:hypothetical protein
MKHEHMLNMERSEVYNPQEIVISKGQVPGGCDCKLSLPRGKSHTGKLA